MIIRPFQSADKSALAQIYLRCRQETFHWVLAETFHLKDFDTDTEGEKILVAELGGQPVGFIALWLPDHFIHHLFILPEHQGRGLGKLLLVSGLKEISLPARLKCVVQNARACLFYEGLGWVAESEAVDSMGPYRTYVLSK